MVSVQWKERESYEKTLKEEKTRPRSITSGGGGGGVGQAEAHGDSAMDLQSPRDFFFFEIQIWESWTAEVWREEIGEKLKHADCQHRDMTCQFSEH